MNIAVKMEEGLMALRHGDCSLAQESFQAVITADPSQDLARYYLALALAKLDRLTEAVGHLKTLTRAGGPVEYYLTLGQVLLMLDQFSDARRAYEAALAIQPGPGPRVGLGLVALKARNWTEAEGIFRALVGDYPAESEYLFRLGQALGRQNRGPEAEDCLTAALVMRPEAYEYHMELCELLKRSGQTDRVRALMIKAIKDHPADLRYQVARAEFEMESRNWEAAAAIYAALTQNDESNFRYLFPLAKALGWQGNYGISRVALKKAYDEMHIQMANSLKQEPGS